MRCVYSDMAVGRSRTKRLGHGEAVTSYSAGSPALGKGLLGRIDEFL